MDRDRAASFLGASSFFSQADRVCLFKRTCGMIKYVHQILFHHEQVYIQIDIRGWVTVYVLSSPSTWFSDAAVRKRTGWDVETSLQHLARGSSKSGGSNEPQPSILIKICEPRDSSSYSRYSSERGFPRFLLRSARSRVLRPASPLPSDRTIVIALLRNFMHNFSP